MDEYRSDATLRHFHTRSAGLCAKAPIQTGSPVNVNFYVQYDHPKTRAEITGDKFTYMGTSTKPTQNNIIKARKTSQFYMSDN